MEFLTRKLGPLPAWAWGGIAGVGFILVRRFRGGSSAGDEGAVAAVPLDAEGNPVPLYGSGTVLGYSDAYGAAGYDAQGSGVSPELLDRLAAIEDAVLNPAPAPGVEDSLEEIRAGQETIRQIIEAPRPEPAPIAVQEPPPPPPPQPPPAPVRTYPAPVSGTIIWTGENKPNPATIENLIRARYGRAVPWDARKTGPATARSGPDWVAVLR